MDVQENIEAMTRLNRFIEFESWRKNAQSAPIKSGNQLTEPS